VTSVSLEEEIIAFVAAEMMCSTKAITASTTLFGDLGVDGDDGDEFLVAFMKRFSVDMSGYRGNRHFGPEGFVPWAPLVWLLLALRLRREPKSTPESRAGLIPVPVQVLIDSARAGKWALTYAQTG
jgi:hypothetical protein